MDDEFCPKCKSEAVAGLVAAFWVSMDTQEANWKSESQIGPERHCGECGHEWDADTMKTKKLAAKRKSK